MARKTHIQQLAANAYHDSVQEFGGLQGWRHMSPTVQRAMVRSRILAVVTAQDDSIPAEKVVEFMHGLVAEVESFFADKDVG